jgi:hypothetical protein
MRSTLHIEFFDTDASSCTHRLKLPLKSPTSFRVAEANILEVEHGDGTTRHVPLANVRQYYATANPSETDQASAQESQPDGKL